MYHFIVKPILHSYKLMLGDGLADISILLIFI